MSQSQRSPSHISRPRMLAWVVWFVGSLFYAYQYILRVMPNIMLGDIMQQFKMDVVLFGQFSGIYYIGYCLMHIPVGIMLDRYGPRRVMSGCILLTVLGLLPLILAEHWAYPIMGRALMGMGSSAAILGVFKILRVTFSEEKFARMLSLAVTIGLLGAIYGGEPVSYMTQLLGYQAVIEIFALMGVILAVATYLIVPDAKEPHSGTIYADLKEVLGNSKVIWTCLFAGFMVGPMEGFADVWATVFFKQVYGLDNAMASRLPSMIFIGMCFGAPVLNYIAEKTRNYLATIMVAGILMALSFFVLISGELTNTNMMVVSFIVVGVACAYQILAIYKASTYVREEVVGLTTAVANMIIMSFGYAFHTLIGLIINITGGTESSHAFIYGISIIPIMLSIGVCGFGILLYRERYNKKLK